MKNIHYLIAALGFYSTTSLASTSQAEIDLFRILFFGGPVVLVGVIFFVVYRLRLSNKTLKTKNNNLITKVSYALIISNVIFEVVFLMRLNSFVNVSGQSWLYILSLIPVIVVILLVFLIIPKTSRL